MKFLHIADLHIGKYLNQISLIDDQKYILNQIIEIMKENNVTNLIISGDVYNRQVPSKEAVSIFNDFLNELINNLNYKVYMISGNHDSIERLNFASNILKSKGLYIESYTKTPLSSYEVKDEYGKLNIYMMPFCTPLYAKNILKIDSSTYEEMIKKIIEESNINFTERNILLTHHTVLHQNNVLRSDSEMGISIGGTEGIEGEYFKDFDYVALGHLHNPQFVYAKHIRYSGSILKYSESEANVTKSCVLIDIKEKNNIDIKLIDLLPLHDVVKIKGSFLDLTKDPTNQITDYIYFTLTDERVVTNAMKRLKVKYPNAVSLKYENIKLSFGASQAQISNDFHNLSLKEQFSEFFTAVTDKPLNDNQEEILNELIKGGVFNETN